MVEEGDGELNVCFFNLGKKTSVVFTCKKDLVSQHLYCHLREEKNNPELAGEGLLVT